MHRRSGDLGAFWPQSVTISRAKLSKRFAISSALWKAPLNGGQSRVHQEMPEQLASAGEIEDLRALDGMNLRQSKLLAHMGAREIRKEPQALTLRTTAEVSRCREQWTTRGRQRIDPSVHFGSWLALIS
jgi:hypothetical protein